MKELIYTASTFPTKDFGYKNKIIKINQLNKLFTELIHLYVISHDEYIRVLSSYLKKICNDYRIIFKYLEQENIIRINNKYSAGRFTKSYLFTEYFKTKILELIDEIKPILIQSRKQFSHNYLKTSKNHIIDNSIQNKLFKDFISIKRINEINNYGYFVKYHHVDEFKAALKNFYYDTQNAFNQKSFYKIDVENSRLYTSFCNIKKELREEKYYFKEGRKLKNKDIKSSHIFFLAVMLLEDYDAGRLNKDEYFKFISLVLNPKNDIYKYFQKKYFTGMSRSRIKKLFFIMLFGDNETKYKLLKLNKTDDVINYKGYNIQINDSFWYEFETLWEAIKNRKWIAGRLDKSQLTKELNKLEADFLFNKVIKRLYKEVKGIQVVSVHDQFYYSEEYDKQVTQIWDDETGKLYELFNEITCTQYYKDTAIEPSSYIKDENANMSLKNWGIDINNGDEEPEFGLSLWDELGVRDELQDDEKDDYDHLDGYIPQPFKLVEQVDYELLLEELKSAELSEKERINSEELDVVDEIDESENIFKLFR